jgi:peptide/nickel transport system ATP-binding protein
VEVADSVSLFAEPLHPYTQALLGSVPNIKLVDDELKIMHGLPPDLINPPSGCRFHPRCPHAFERCASEIPTLKEIRDGRYAACWLYDGK